MNPEIYLFIGWLLGYFTGIIIFGIILYFMKKKKIWRKHDKKMG